VVEKRVPHSANEVRFAEKRLCHDPVHSIRTKLMTEDSTIPLGFTLNRLYESND
jgi:hypothetical protein